MGTFQDIKQQSGLASVRVFVRTLVRTFVRGAAHCAVLTAVVSTSAVVGGGNAALAEPVRLVSERGYQVQIVGVQDGLLTQLEGISQLVARQSVPPASIGGLRRRAQSDVQRMTKVLQSRGYFEGRVAYRIDAGTPAQAAVLPVDATAEVAVAQAASLSSSVPVSVVVDVAPGPQFKIGTNDISYMDTSATLGDVPHDLPADLSSFGVQQDMPAIAADILDAEKKLVTQLHRQGFPFATLAGRKALADVENDVLTLTTKVQLGDKAKFGPLHVDGLKRVELSYITERQTFQEGDEFDQQKLSEMRTILVKSGLFDGVRFTSAKSVTTGGLLPVTLTVSERAPRTIGAGASYSSTEGFGLNAHWEHRNLFGGGQHLRLEAHAAQIEQQISARYRVAGFQRADQTLELGVDGGRDSTDVYERLGGIISSTVERPLSDKWTGRAGVLFDGAQVDEVGEPDSTSLLFGVPLQASYDNANSVLDPTRGYRVLLGATPYAGHFNDALAFHLGDAEVRTYLPFDEDARLVFATRARFGSIIGARTGELPADKRFYAGGAGSVRGFEFQGVSPLGADGTADGGRSIVELSNELRWRFMDDFGIVPFVDGGIVSDASVPDFDDQIAWGGGLGFRYYTSFGPVGVDLAYPITSPNDEDASLKFYVKLGQAF